ncbi:MAG: hypothetical protein PVI23_02720 [Maricaulaceae bacterium]
MSAGTAIPPASAADASDTGGGPFTFRVVITMVIVGVFSFAAFVVLSAFADDLRVPTDGGTHALSKSAVGYAGLVDLMERRGAPVVVQRGPVRDTEGLRIVTPLRSVNAADEFPLIQGEHTLVILPKWVASPNPLALGWVSKLGVMSEERVAAAAPAWAGQLTVSRAEGAGPARILPRDPEWNRAGPLRLGEIESFQTISGKSITPILAAPDGGIVLGFIAGTGTYILSDPDLMNTHGIGDPDTAWAAVQILDNLAGRGRPMIFDVAIHGFARSRNILKLAFEPPFLPAVICAALAAGLMGWRGAVRFGPARKAGRVHALGKRALIDNSAGLITMTRREAHMSGSYAEMTRAAVARAIGGRGRMSAQEQAEMLDRMSAAGHLPTTYSQLAEKAEAATDRASLLEAARALFAWRGEITGERS